MPGNTLDIEAISVASSTWVRPRGRFVSIENHAGWILLDPDTSRAMAEAILVVAAQVEDDDVAVSQAGP